MLQIFRVEEGGSSGSWNLVHIFGKKRGVYNCQLTNQTNVLLFFGGPELDLVLEGELPEVHAGPDDVGHHQLAKQHVALVRAESQPGTNKDKWP